MPSESNQLVTTASVVERIYSSINVSGAMDNCFFHCYALHLLSNNLSLPPDLFSFGSVAGTNSHASQLRASFTNSEDLSRFFENYNRGIASTGVQPSFIFERTLVLGILLREYFATKMNSPTMMERCAADAIDRFIEYKTLVSQRIQTHAEMLESSNLIGANSDFLQYYAQRTEANKDNPSVFKRYFDGAADDRVALTAYYQSEGHANYVRYIARPLVKIIIEQDILAVLESLGQPCTLYGERGDISCSQNTGDTSRLEIVLMQGAGHYHLLRNTSANQPLLDEYARVSAAYKAQAEAARELEYLNLSGTGAANMQQLPLVAVLVSARERVTDSLIDRIRNPVLTARDLETVITECDGATLRRRLATGNSNLMVNSIINCKNFSPQVALALINKVGLDQINDGLLLAIIQSPHCNTVIICKILEKTNLSLGVLDALLAKNSTDAAVIAEINSQAIVGLVEKLNELIKNTNNYTVLDKALKLLSPQDRIDLLKELAEADIPLNKIDLNLHKLKIKSYEFAIKAIDKSQDYSNAAEAAFVLYHQLYAANKERAPKWQESCRQHINASVNILSAPRCFDIRQLLLDIANTIAKICTFGQYDGTHKFFKIETAAAKIVQEISDDVNQV